jgi:hypothetical protein
LQGSLEADLFFIVSGNLTVSVMREETATDSALREKLRRAARTTVEPQSWSKVIVRFEQDLASIVGENSDSATRQPQLASL